MHQTAEDDARFELAQRVALRFLSRFSDPFTRGMCDDLAQDSAVQSWYAYDAVVDKASFPNYVRTIARRRRARWIESVVKRRCQSLDCDGGLLDEASLTAPVEDVRRLLVDYVPVKIGTLTDDLDDVTTRLSQLNRCLLRNFYEGFSCVELAELYGMSATSIKVRLHRARRRVRSGYESRIDEATGRYVGGLTARGTTDRYATEGEDE